MVKVSRKPKAKPQQEEQIDDIFAALSRHNSGGDTPAQTVTSRESTPDPATLLAQIAELNTRLARTEEEKMALMAQPLVATSPAVSQAQGLDMKDLPDPILDPDKYANELNARIARTVQSHQDTQRQEQQKENERQTQLSTLWDDFAIQYPDISDNPGRIKYVSGLVADAAKARGIDLNRYIFGNSSRFMADVAARYETEFGDGEVDTPAPRRKATDPEPNRTGGIFGGLESGNRPGPSNPPPGDMIKDIHDMQRKSGFF